MKKLERRTYKVYGGQYTKWENVDGKCYSVPVGEPIAFMCYATVVTAKVKEAINLGRGYYNANVVVVDVTTKTIVYERKNGRDITNILL